VVFAPLWFIGVYAGVVAAVPITARLHRAWGWRVLAVFAAAVLAADVLRLGPGWGGLVGPGLVLAGLLAVMFGSRLAVRRLLHRTHRAFP
jgi:hypothetical protein